MVDPIPPLSMQQPAVIETASPAARVGGATALAVFCACLVVANVVASSLRSSVIIFMVAALILAGSWRSITTRFRWDAPELHIDAYPLHLGGTAKVQYFRRSKKPTDVGPFEVHLKVICEERVRYKKGTDVRTDTSRVFTQSFVGTGNGTANGAEASVFIDVPTDAGAPTMKLRSNEIIWKIEVVVEGGGLPQGKHWFSVIVTPVLASGSSGSVSR